MMLLICVSNFFRHIINAVLYDKLAGLVAVGNKSVETRTIYDRTALVCLSSLFVLLVSPAAYTKLAVVVVRKGVSREREKTGTHESYNIRRHRQVQRKTLPTEKRRQFKRLLGPSPEIFRSNRSIISPPNHRQIKIFAGPTSTPHTTHAYTRTINTTCARAIACLSVAAHVPPA